MSSKEHRDETAPEECCGCPEWGGPCPDCPDPEVLEWWRKRLEDEDVTNG
jgi:hypothetical protein